VLRLSSAGPNASGYGLEVDIWSLGVILYVLYVPRPLWVLVFRVSLTVCFPLRLSGMQPFHEGRQHSLFTQIEQGEFDFPEEQWQHISRSAIDLISKMMQVDPRKRITIKEALQHPWAVVRHCFAIPFRYELVCSSLPCRKFRVPLQV
jgi:serine/threonine protein kinase